MRPPPGAFGRKYTPVCSQHGIMLYSYSMVRGLHVLSLAAPAPARGPASATCPLCSLPVISPQPSPLISRRTVSTLNTSLPNKSKWWHKYMSFITTPKIQIQIELHPNINTISLHHYYKNFVYRYSIFLVNTLVTLNLFKIFLASASSESEPAPGPQCSPSRLSFSAVFRDRSSEPRWNVTRGQNN